MDLTPFLTHPLGEEISLALMGFISIFLALWLLSKIFYFKKQDYKTALSIATIVAATFFIIRSVSLILSLKDAQKPPINLTSMIVEAFLLLILIKEGYNLKWLKAIGIWIVTYVGKLMITGIITFIVLFFFTTIPQEIAKERADYTANWEKLSIEEAQKRVNFKILAPTYLPTGYNLDYVEVPKNISKIYAEIPPSQTYAESINLYYHNAVDGKKGMLLKLSQRVSEMPKFPLSGDKVIINGEETIYTEGPHNTFNLLWYSEKYGLLIRLHTGIDSDLNKEEMIKITGSIE